MNLCLIAVLENWDYEKAHSQALSQSELLDNSLFPDKGADSAIGQVSLSCYCCKEVFVTKAELNSHICSLHGNTVSQTEPVPKFHPQNHINPAPILPFPCSFCGTTFFAISDLESHVIRYHKGSSNSDVSSIGTYLKSIVEQNQKLLEVMADFKQSVDIRLAELKNEQEKFRSNVSSDIAALKKQVDKPTVARCEENTALLSEGFDTLFNGIKIIEGHQVHMSQQLSNLASASALNPQQGSERSTSVTQKPKHPPKTCNKCDFIVHSKDHLRKHMKVRHGAKDSIVWVADSINYNTDFKDISVKTGMDVHPVRANLISEDPEGASVHGKNFIDVVEEELNSRIHNILVLGGGTSEITNLDTKTSPEMKLSEFRDKVIKSSKALFSLAETALHEHSTLNKVIILKKPPRFDPTISDPMELKPQLSRLADTVLFELWCESRYKEKIFIGDHHIPHRLDDEHREVFGHPDSNHYDGIHLRGPGGRRTFHRSILNILSSAGICPLKTHPPPPPKKNLPPHQGQYNPLKMFRQRLSSRKETMADKNPNLLPPPPPARQSVIRSSARSLQEHYTVPISNSFSTLGN